MYVLDDNGIKCECVVIDVGNGVLEIKNIATVPEYQGKGYAKAMIDFIITKYREEYSILQVGTGDSLLTMPFYEKCGFVHSHIIPNFFTATQAAPCRRRHPPRYRWTPACQAWAALLCAWRGHWSWRLIYQGWMAAWRWCGMPTSAAPCSSACMRTGRTVQPAMQQQPAIGSSLDRKSVV